MEKLDLSQYSPLAETVPKVQLFSSFLYNCQQERDDHKIVCVIIFCYLSLDTHAYIIRAQTPTSQVCACLTPSALALSQLAPPIGTECVFYTVINTGWMYLIGLYTRPDTHSMLQKLCSLHKYVQEYACGTTLQVQKWISCSTQLFLHFFLRILYIRTHIYRRYRHGKCTWLLWIHAFLPLFSHLLQHNQYLVLFWKWLLHMVEINTSQIYTYKQWNGYYMTYSWAVYW